MSFCIAATVNYQLTSKFVFKQRATRQRFALFLLAALVGLTTNAGITVAGNAYMGLRPIFSKICGIGVAFVINFSLNVGFVYRKWESARLKRILG